MTSPGRHTFRDARDAVKEAKRKLATLGPLAVIERRYWEHKLFVAVRRLQVLLQDREARRRGEETKAEREARERSFWRHKISRAEARVRRLKEARDAKPRQL